MKINQIPFKIILVVIMIITILTVFIVMVISSFDHLSYSEHLYDKICSVRNSHDMSLITLCESNREFTLLIEDYETISSFIHEKETIIYKDKNTLELSLVNPSKDTLKITFEIDDNRLIRGKLKQ